MIGKLLRLVRRAPRTLANVGRRVASATRAEWYAWWRRRPVDASVVLFESFAGNGATCNPEALFRALHRAPDLAGLRSVWALDARSARVLRAEFRGDARVRVVRRDGPAYWRWLATAGTLVNNATFPPAFDRRPEQTYCNTWHGTPLKRMGFDEPDGAFVSANVVRNFLQATLLLAQSPTMTDVMYAGAYRLAGFAPARVLEVGYPRNDHLVVGPAEHAAIRARLVGTGTTMSAGVGVDHGIVLYAPTWHGDRFSAPEDHSAEIADAAAAMQAALVRAGSRARVLVKPHQAVMAFARDEPALAGRLVPEDVPVNAVLAVTDVLVSDYSSIAVDFLATGRPVVFAGLDDGTYAATRGLYVDPAQFPGRRCTDLGSLGDEVARAVLHGIDPAFADRYRTMAAELVPMDDGHASERVLDVLFRGADGGRSLREDDAAPRRRRSILVHLGGMRENGITSAAVNLLHALAEAAADPDADCDLDVTALFPRSTGASATRSRARIDPRIRQVQRIGGMNGSKLLLARRRWADLRGDGEAHRTDPRLASLWDDEWHRCLGDATFDAVVDFSGYSPFWATLLLHARDGGRASTPALHAIWLHNDMRAEVDRLVGGRPRMRRSLRAVIALYDQHDRVVSVSASLRDHNRAMLTAVRASRFRAARNLIDDTAVVRGAATTITTMPGAAVLDDPALVRFACVGRLSPEKNHDRLLRAFALVHADRPDTRLFIVGDGYLRDRLEALAHRLGIGAAVVFTGAVPDAAAVMTRADCVVVSSDHEGQPMVILEAAVLGRAIVSTRFESAADALPGDQLHLVDRSVDGLAEGMRAFLAGRVPPTALDVAAYDAAALREFLTATLEPDPSCPDPS